MQFTTLSTLYEITGYSDRRSVQKFLASLSVRLHKVGKQYCVITKEFETALILKYGQLQEFKPKKKNVVSNLHEQSFLNDLRQFLSQV